MTKQLLAKRMKCEGFGSYSGSGDSAMFLLTDWFILQQSELKIQRLFQICISKAFYLYLTLDFE